MAETPNPAAKAPEPKPTQKPEPPAPKPAAPGPPPMPGASELARIRDKRFGGEPGAVHIDADYAAGTTALVFVDGRGVEVERQPYKPKPAT